MYSRLSLLILTLLALVILVSAAKLPQVSVVISWPEGTPGHVLDAAKKTIEEAGGMVTHEYQIFKGFAATAPTKAFETVKTLAAKWVPIVEEDFIVSVQD